MTPGAHLPEIDDPRCSSTLQGGGSQQDARDARRALRVSVACLQTPHTLDSTSAAHLRGLDSITELTKQGRACRW